MTEQISIAHAEERADLNCRVGPSRHSGCREKHPCQKATGENKGGEYFFQILRFLNVFVPQLIDTCVQCNIYTSISKASKVNVNGTDVVTSWVLVLIILLAMMI